jgi:pimeloyl-ACP methyl ester carboxylesterase
MPAIFVHGVPDTHREWDALRSHLSRDDVVAVDLPGFGSPVPGGFDATKEAYAAWLVEQMEKAGEPVDLVGHDWGALLVWRAASLRPDLVRTWAAGGAPLDGEYVWHQAAQTWQTAGQGEAMMQAMTPEVMAGALTGAGVPDDKAKEAASQIDGTMKDCILKLYRSAVTVGAEWEADTSKLPKRGLVLWGADDPYVEVRFAHRMAERTGAELLVFEGCGHWWPQQRPAEAAAALERLWASVT